MLALRIPRRIEADEDVVSKALGGANLQETYLAWIAPSGRRIVIPTEVEDRHTLLFGGQRARVANT